LDLGKQEEANEQFSLLIAVYWKRPSPESAKQHRKLRAAYKKAKELDIGKVFIKGKNLTVNSTVYSVENLPDYLLPQKNVSD